ncbi:CheR family methyltransferase [Streptomyces sp. NPDC006132]|uniref:CheR family methyltransferase n=1 Tax=Streptomyces sp. NPDC006132 TaxID=3156732 RepID=UPI0033EE9C60
MAGRKIVTEWFRMPAVWPIIGDALAQFDEPVTVWSGACGTGEEPYSAAILMEERGLRGRVTASDIDVPNLRTAARGWYAGPSIRRELADGRMTAEQLCSHFVPRKGGYVVRPGVRDRVSFSALHLGSDAPPECHVALLRNVWRHIEPAGQATLTAQLSKTLAPGGLLVLGGADLLTPTLEPTYPRGLLDHFTPSGFHSAVWRAVSR